MFGDNDDVAFGDVLLSGGGPRGAPHASPGAGGWPTIRYYNAETGVAGHNYDKQTDMAMCDELGPKGDVYMRQYVETIGKTSLCSINEPYTGCSDKEKAYIAKVSEWDADKVAAQITRLDGMAGDKMTPDLAKWKDQRLAVLNSLSKAAAAEAASKDEL